MPDNTIPHWVTFWSYSGYVIGLNSAVGAKYLRILSRPLDCFAVIDPEASRSQINSITASVFPSGLL